MNHKEFLYKTLPQEAISDLEWAMSAFKIQFQINDLEDIPSLMNTIESCNSDRIFFWMQDEIPPNGHGSFLNFLENLYKSKKDIRIGLGTTSKFPFSINPFVNFNTFREVAQPVQCLPYVGLLNNPEDYTPRFPTDRYYIGKKIDFESKKIKGILSIRKNSWWRNKFKTQINNKFDGIYRSVEFEHGNTYTFEDSKKFPTWNELLDEYDSSLVAFVMETDHVNTDSQKFKMNPITEKTPLAFMNFCIPILFGKSQYLEELESLGFWVANKDFEFSIGDYCYRDEDILKFFIKCVHKFNKMSLKQIKAYYLDNMDKIQNNYNLMASVISNEYLNDNFGGYDLFQHDRLKGKIISNNNSEFNNDLI